MSTDDVKFRGPKGLDFNPYETERTHFDFVKPNEMRYLKNADEVRDAYPIDSMELTVFDRFPMQPQLPPHHPQLDADWPYQDGGRTFIENMLASAWDYHRKSLAQARAGESEIRRFGRWLDEYLLALNHGRRAVADEAMRLHDGMKAKAARTIAERAAIYQARIHEVDRRSEVRQYFVDEMVEGRVRELDFRRRQEQGVAYGSNQNRPRGKKS